MYMDYKSKKIIVFDVDQTICESKSNIDKEMSELLCDLLKIKQVAILSGGSCDLLENIVFKQMSCRDLFHNGYIFGQVGTYLKMYKNNNWECIYALTFPVNDIDIIIKNMQELVNQEKEKFTNKLQGRIIENRETSITITLAGQDSPYEFKKDWNRINNEERKKFFLLVKDYLYKTFGENVYTASLGGTSSIDITQYGKDKAYAINYMVDNFDITLKEILFLGDALYEGGNDYIVRSTGIEVIQVKDIQETKKYIRSIIKLCEKVN